MTRDEESPSLSFSVFSFPFVFLLVTRFFGSTGTSGWTTTEATTGTTTGAATAGFFGVLRAGAGAGEGEEGGE